MIKPRASARYSCYGCDSLIFEPTQPLLDGWCHYFDKPVRVVSTDDGFYHLQIEECLLEE